MWKRISRPAGSQKIQDFESVCCTTCTELSRNPQDKRIERERESQQKQKLDERGEVGESERARLRQSCSSPLCGVMKRKNHTDALREQVQWMSLFERQHKLQRKSPSSLKADQ